MSNPEPDPLPPGTGGLPFAPLLAAPSFHDAAEALAGDFRREHGLPPLHQIGLVAGDVDVAVGELGERGVRGFAVSRGCPESWEEDGESRSFSGRMALAVHQGLELEILEPGEGSEFYRAGLDAGGAVALHHLGFLVDDVDAWAGAMVRAGQRTWVRGALARRRATVRFVYVDSRRDAGIILEFISVTIGGRPVRRSLLGMGASARR